MRDMFFLAVLPLMLPMAISLTAAWADGASNRGMANMAMRCRVFTWVSFGWMRNAHASGHV